MRHRIRTSRVGESRLWRALAATVLVGATLVVSGTPASAAGTATLSGPTSLLEGTNGTFTVTRNDTTVAETITFAVTPTGGAVAGDFSTAGSLAFAIGDVSQSFTVTAVDDAITETGEGLSVDIVSSTDGTTLFAGGPIAVTLDDNPSAVNDTYAVTEDGSLTTTAGGGPGSEGVLDNDTEGVTAALVTSTSNGTLGLNADGSFTYTPSANFDGSDSFTYNAVNGGQTSLGTVTINITPQDDPPVAVNDNYAVNEDAVLTVPVGTGVRANDSDPDSDDPLTSLVVNIGTTTTNGALSLNNDGSFTYTPNANYDGPDSFTYTLADPDGLNSGSATVSITVNDLNAAPVANADSFFEGTPALRNATATLPVAANDTDQDLDPLTVSAPSATSAEGGAVACSGVTCTYTAPADFVGIDTFAYDVTDGSATVAGAVTVHVGMPSGCTQTGTNLTGTPGNDILCGTAGNDTINGGGGNDIIVGNGGDDTLDGGAGNDLVHGGAGNDTITNSGGVDEMVGGTGTDTLGLAATGGADNITLNDTTDGTNTFSLFEVINVDFAGGDDIVAVAPSTTTSFNLNGNAGFDRLTYQSAGVSGVADNGSVITATGRQPVAYTSFEVVSSNTLNFLGTPNDDEHGFNGSTIAGLQIDLLNGSDKATIDLGALVGPVAVNDSGASGTDTAVVRGQAAGEQFDIGTNVLTVGSETVSWQGVEVVEFDGRGGNDVFDIDVDSLTGAATNLRILGGPGIDRLIFTSSATCTIDAVSDPATIVVGGRTLILESSLEGFDVTCAGNREVGAAADGYWVGESGGGLFSFGQVQHHGHAPGPINSPLAALAAHPAHIGHWAAEADGTVHALGLAVNHGGVDHLSLNSPIVSMTPTPTGDGYYLLGGDGGVFTFGDAAFYGSTGNIVLAQPVVAIAANPQGGGYWFVASDGGVFTYGPNTQFHGSVPQVVQGPLNKPVVGMAPTATGLGYWLVASDGGVFTFGDAAFHGSIPQVVSGPLNSPIIGIVATPSGQGYWMIAADGGVFTFGDAPFYGSLGGTGISTVVDLAG